MLFCFYLFLCFSEQHEVKKKIAAKNNRLVSRRKKNNHCLIDLCNNCLSQYSLWLDMLALPSTGEFENKRPVASVLI